jgi:hypothetical protein
MRRHYLVAAGVAAVTLAFGGGMAVSRSLEPRPNEVAYNIPRRADGSVNPDPFLASGVGMGRNVAVYTASGTGPGALNPLAEAV